jgi:transposase
VTTCGTLAGTPAGCRLGPVEIEDGLQVSEAAAKAGVTRQALHSWLARYAEGGLDGLADRSHRPRSCPHQMSPAVEVRLVELRGLHPGWGVEGVNASQTRST